MSDLSCSAAGQIPSFMAAEEDFPSHVLFLLRLMALAIDLVLLIFAHLIFSIIAVYLICNIPFLSFQETFFSFFLCWAAFCLLPLLSGMCYFSVLHASNGRTIGKGIMGIKVVSSAGGNLCLGSSFLRWAGYWVSALPFFLGFFWSVGNEQSRAWHDVISDSMVVLDEPGE